jgi:hypothetical protein
MRQHAQECWRAAAIVPHTRTAPGDCSVRRLPHNTNAGTFKVRVGSKDYMDPRQWVPKVQRLAIQAEECKCAGAETGLHAACSDAALLTVHSMLCCELPLQGRGGWCLRALSATQAASPPSPARTPAHSKYGCTRRLAGTVACRERMGTTIPWHLYHTTSLHACSHLCCLH